VLTVLLAAASCRPVADETLVRVHATIIRPPKDTTRLGLPGESRRCIGGHAQVLEALSTSGEGILVRLRYRDSLTSGAYPFRAPGDSPAPGAVAAIRYQVGGVPHTVLLDSGSFDVERSGRSLTARTQASGLENAVRLHATVEFRDVAERADSIACRDLP
jgi:hypothetical protein